MLLRYCIISPVVDNPSSCRHNPPILALASWFSFRVVPCPVLFYNHFTIGLRIVLIAKNIDRPRIMLPAVAIHRLGVVEIAPISSSLFSHGPPLCAIGRSMVDMDRRFISLRDRLRLTVISSNVWHVCFVRFQGRRSGYESGGGRHTCQSREKFWRDKRGATERSEPTLEGGSGGPPPENFKTLDGKWCNLRYS